MISIKIGTYYVDFYETCGACPEQYDVFIEGKQVGYVRLRWAHLRCEYPDVGGREVYSHSWGGKSGLDGYLGEFPSNEEREFHLERIAEILYNEFMKSETVR